MLTLPEETAQTHGLRHGIAHFELEINQQLVTEPAGALEVAARLTPVATRAGARTRQPRESQSS